MTEENFIMRLIAWSIEFEGSINIAKQSRNDIPFYKTEIRINNSEIELLEEFKKITKIGKIDYGSIDSYNWKLIRKERDKYASLIYPYLISKQEQMELVIEANKILKIKEFVYKLSYHDKREMYTYEEICQLEFLYQRCKELNEQGKIKIYEVNYDYKLHKRQYINDYYNAQLLAFAFDWEGSIGINRVEINGCFHYIIQVSLDNTERPILETFNKVLGFGHTNGPHIVYDYKNKYSWLFSRKEIEKYLPGVLTHLTMKWRQAELVIETNQILKTGKYILSLPTSLRTMSELYTYDELLILENNYQECKLLNDRYENMKRKKLLRKGR